MKSRKLLLALGLLAALIGIPSVADASTMSMCRATAAVNASGPGQWLTAAGTRYSLNVRGCANIAGSDIGEALANGFVSADTVKSLVSITNAAAFTMQLPPSAYIVGVIARETSGSNVTGGLKIGTTSGATDVVSVMNIASGQVITATDVSLTKRAFSATSAQTLFIGANSSFNQSAIDLTILYAPF